ncbi:MAG: formate dehydrogenase subunit delta [Verrucomicrobia bacterium]|nr:MAG: formate dehydrogenase subunit delta [Verrucomicrobiota bacterium]
MDQQHLVRMANSIGDFFEAMPDRQEALGGIAGHIKRFWEPRMRKELMAYVDAGGHGLQDIVREAIAGDRIA